MTLRCTIVTPEKAVLDATIDSVILPMIDGELGVYPGREALVGRLGPGELRLNHGTTTDHYFIDGGFAQVKQNLVTVLTAKAILVSALNAEKASQELVTAEALPSTNELEREKKSKALALAHAQVRLTQKKYA